MASSVNLLVALRELESAGMTEFAKKYSNVVDILKTIDKGDHNSGPLTLAVQLGIITEGEVPQVMSLAKYAGDKNFNIDKTNLSKNLKDLYKTRTAEDPSKIVPLNHLVASIAYKVCNEINMKTNFSEAAADILNHSAFVQMYTEASKDKNGQFTIKGFKTVWPSKLFTEVTLEAQKSYSSTSSSSGKLVFNINKEPKVIDNVEKAATTDAPGGNQAGEIVDYMGPQGAEQIDTATQQRSDITAAPAPEKLGSEKSLGRKRQR